MMVELVRTLRTPHSERFILRRAGSDCGALDIHYLPKGHVSATLVVFEGAGLAESEIPALLSYLDEVLLPDVSLDDHRLVFTVVTGRVHGAFEADTSASAART